MSPKTWRILVAGVLLFLGYLGAVRAASYHQLVEGRSYLNQGRAQEAVQCLNRAIKLQPHQPEAFLVRGQAYLELEQPREAAVDLDNAYSLGQRSSSLFFARARAREAQGEPEQAASDYRRVVEMEGESALGTKALGRLEEIEPVSSRDD